MAKTWKQKLDDGREPKVEPLSRPYAGAPEGAMMLVSTPREVEAYMRRVPPGETRTIAQMRDELAQAHGAQVTCPMSTSIFARIAAEAALEEVEHGRRPEEVTPFWRLIEPDAPLAKRLSCGPGFVAARRSAERARP